MAEPHPTSSSKLKSDEGIAKRSNEHTTGTGAAVISVPVCSVEGYNNVCSVMRKYPGCHFSTCFRHSKAGELAAMEDEAQDPRPGCDKTRKQIGDDTMATCCSYD